MLKLKQLFDYLYSKAPKLNEDVTISDNLKYHINKKLPLTECVFRYGSEAHLNLINEVRELYNENKIKLSLEDTELIKTDIGLKDIFENEEVFLDLPLLNESEYQGREVDLNQPMKSSGNKPYKVYVKNDKGNVVKVEFGSGMRAKINDEDARSRFNARHGCSKGRHNDKTKAGYWSCRLPRYAKQLGLSYSGTAQWW